MFRSRRRGIHLAVELRKVLLISLFIVGCDAPKSYHNEERIEANFKTINSSIIESRCVECHGPKKQAKKIDLSSYEKIMSKDIFPPLVIPGNPERSSLYQSVISGDMPKNRPRLSNRELQAIYDWIKNGALKDEMPKPKKPDETTEPEPGGEETGDEPGGGNEPGGSNEPGGNNEPGGTAPGDEPGQN